MSDVDANEFVDAGCEFVFVLSREDLDVDYDTAFAVGHTQGRVTHFSCLFAEDCAEQSLFGSKFGFALRGDLTDENVARFDLCADHDDTVFIEVFEHFVAEVRNISGDLLVAEFGVAAFDFVLFDVNRSVQIVAHELFADKDRVLVVVTFPGHEADEHVSAQRKLAVVGCGTVCDDRAFSCEIALVVIDRAVHFVALADDRMLIYAS